LAGFINQKNGVVISFLSKYYEIGRYFVEMLLSSDRYEMWNNIRRRFLA